METETVASKSKANLRKTSASRLSDITNMEREERCIYVLASRYGFTEALDYLSRAGSELSSTYRFQDKSSKKELTIDKFRDVMGDKRYALYISSIPYQSELNFSTKNLISYLELEPTLIEALKK